MTDRAIRFAISLLLALPGTALADAVGVSVRNEASSARGFLLPALGRDPAGQGWSLQLDLSNEFVVQQEPGESLILDSETASLRPNWQGRYGVWALGVDLQFLHQGGGFMDGPIQDWHEFFGLPNAGRERRSEDQLQIQYQREGNTRIDSQDSGAGLGDTQLWLGRSLGEHSHWRVALSLPTGDEAQLRGSGELGVGGWLESQWQGSRFSGFTAVGLSHNPAGGLLAELRRETIGYAGAALNWRWTEWLLMRSQLYAHSPLYENTRIEALERPGLQLSLGGTLNFGAVAVDILFQEDVVTTSSSDFAWHLAVRLGN